MRIKDREAKGRYATLALHVLINLVEIPVMPLWQSSYGSSFTVPDMSVPLYRCLLYTLPLYHWMVYDVTLYTVYCIILICLMRGIIHRCLMFTWNVYSNPLFTLQLFNRLTTAKSLAISLFVMSYSSVYRRHFSLYMLGCLFQHLKRYTHCAHAQMRQSSVPIIYYTLSGVYNISRMQYLIHNMQHTVSNIHHNITPNIYCTLPRAFKRHSKHYKQQHTSVIMQYQIIYYTVSGAYSTRQLQYPTRAPRRTHEMNDAKYSSRQDVVRQRGGGDIKE